MQTEVETKMIVLAVFVSMLICLHARAVEENSLVKTSRCEDNPVVFCRITEGIARLILDPSRSLSLIKEVFNNIRKTFSFREVLEAVLGSFTFPLSTLIHSPGIMKHAIEDIDGDIIPRLKWIIKDIEEDCRESPLQPLKNFISFVKQLVVFIAVEAVEGIVIALSRSGFHDYHENFMFIKGNVIEFLNKIDRLIYNFECTHILSQSSCNKLFHAFQNIAVNPAFNFVNGLMTLVEKGIKKVKQVVFPIVDNLSPSKLQKYCNLVLPEGTCARIFYYVKEMDKFGEEEIRKTRHLVDHVIQWVIEHIFPKWT